MEKSDKFMRPRKFISANLTANSWTPLKRELKKLNAMPLETHEQLFQFLEHYTELYAIVEDRATRGASQYYCYGGTRNMLKIVVFAIRVGAWAILARTSLYQKVAQSAAFGQLPPEYAHFKRLINHVIRFKPFVVRMAWENLIAMRYGGIMAKQILNFQGQKLTPARIEKFYEDPDQAVREAAWRTRMVNLLSLRPKLNALFDRLLKMRTKTALKYGFTNVRDYYHEDRGHVDYTPTECFQFHKSIEEVVVPIIQGMNRERKAFLKVDKLRPWDANIKQDYPPLWGKSPYKGADPKELMEKVILIYKKIHSRFGEILEYMNKQGFIDPENRKGKMPGAMCMPLLDHQAGFIVANCIGKALDVNTLAHEGGHAIHWAHFAPLPVSVYIEGLLIPSELAEVPSMSMELLMLEFLDAFIDDKTLVRDIKRGLLDHIIRLLPWIATIDAFQQWIYTNPGHSADDRDRVFGELMDSYEVNAGVDWNGLDAEKKAQWLRQPHIFQSPFYYIEYGISQLAALGIYRNLLQNREQAIKQFEALLKLGYSRPLPELYQVAGIKFDFSKEYLTDLMQFVQRELKK